MKIVLLLTILLAAATTLIAQNGSAVTTTSPTDTAKKTTERGLGKDIVLSVGSNFNFIDNLITGTIYADAMGFLPNLWGSENTPWSSVGIDAGIQQGRSTTNDTSAISRSRLDPPRAVSDSLHPILLLEREIGQNVTNNTTVYIAPTMLAAKNLYFTIHLEYRYRTYELSTTREYVAADTSKRRDTIEVHQKGRFGEALLGPGALIDLRNDKIELRIKGVVGLGNYDKGVWDLGYLFQFAFGEASSGVKIGGEVRGRGLYAPELLIYAAKSTGIDKIGALFTK